MHISAFIQRVAEYTVYLSVISVTVSCIIGDKYLFSNNSKVQPKCEFSSDFPSKKMHIQRDNSHFVVPYQNWAQKVSHFAALSSSFSFKLFSVSRIFYSSCLYAPSCNYSLTCDFFVDRGTTFGFSPNRPTKYQVLYIYLWNVWTNLSN